MCRAPELLTAITRNISITSHALFLICVSPFNYYKEYQITAAESPGCRTADQEHGEFHGDARVCPVCTTRKGTTDYVPKAPSVNFR